MIRLFLGCVLLMMIVSGCNLNAEQTNQESIVPENRVLPTQTPDDCILRTDWPVYVVQPGDNLTYIAQRTGVTTDELIAANCLVNPNALQRGQELYVPVLPEP